MFFQAGDGIRELVRSRGRGDGYKRQALGRHGGARGDRGLHLLDGGAQARAKPHVRGALLGRLLGALRRLLGVGHVYGCLFYTSDAADERSRVDLGGRRII